MPTHQALSSFTSIFDRYWGDSLQPRRGQDGGLRPRCSYVAERTHFVLRTEVLTIHVMWLYFASTEEKYNHGEDRIRTCDTAFAVYRFSRAALSTTQTPLRYPRKFSHIDKKSSNGDPRETNTDNPYTSLRHSSYLTLLPEQRGFATYQSIRRQDKYLVAPVFSYLYT
jgi:hypothetical protein